MASIAWAPLSTPALNEAQGNILYVGALAAATWWLKGRDVERAVEPALVLGAVVVVVYGLSERVLPGVVELARSNTAAGRLEQPLTYWNAEGAFAALGFVLATRLAGDPGRSIRLAAAGAAAAVPLGLGAYLSFSRAALLAVATGLVALVTLDPSRRQARAAALAVVWVFPAVVAAEILPGVADLQGERRGSGLVLLGVLFASTAGAALAVRTLRRAETEGRLRSDRLGSRVRRVSLGTAAVVVAALLAVAVATEHRPHTRSPAFGATPARFGSADSDRYAYWKVVLRQWSEHPVAGQGEGSFGATWLRERPIADTARDAHSLYLQTLGELGLVGFALLGLTWIGVGLAARRALSRRRSRAVGPTAVLIAYAIHTGLDWDWQMPALTLVAVVSAGFVLALNGRAG